MVTMMHRNSGSRRGMEAQPLANQQAASGHSSPVFFLARPCSIHSLTWRDGPNCRGPSRVFCKLWRYACSAETRESRCTVSSHAFWTVQVNCGQGLLGPRQSLVCDVWVPHAFVEQHLITLHAGSPSCAHPHLYLDSTRAVQFTLVTAESSRLARDTCAPLSCVQLRALSDKAQQHDRHLSPIHSASQAHSLVHRKHSLCRAFPHVKTRCTRRPCAAWFRGMTSLLVSDFGGNHFHTNMFGGGSTHQSQESPAGRHTPVRPSPSSSTNAPRVVAPSADVPMADSAAPQSSSTPGQRSQQQNSSEPNTTAPAAEQAAPTPPSPHFRPHSQQPTPSGVDPAFTNTRTVPSSGPAQSLRSPEASPTKIKVKSLSHIQSFAIDESSPFSQSRSLARRQRRDPADVGPQYEISEMPVSDIIEMVAGLLTKITTTNDRQHDHLHRQIPPSEGTSGLSQQTTSVLAFHGKNVPSISILSYLSRIHKYCPTTYEVFLSLLVYFDRMTERVNAGPMSGLRKANQQSVEQSKSAMSAASTPADSTRPASASAQAATPPPSGSLGKPSQTPREGPQPPSPPQQDLDVDALNLSHFFVVDSFNIHRLVIAGVTCASKFFSDVFYTNSRYAKVCTRRYKICKRLLTTSRSAVYR
jgi:hypothetical protein